MARLGFGGFEVQHTSAAGDGFGDGSVNAVETTITRNGGASAKVNAGADNSIGYDFAGVLNVTYRIRCFFYFTSSPTGGNANLMAIRDTITSGTVRVGNVRMDTSRRIIGADGTLSSPLSLNTWYGIEMEVIGNGVNHTWKVRVDGVDVGSSASAADASTPAVFRIGGTEIFTSHGPTLYMDDWAINDSNGALNNSWPGVTEKIVLLPAVADNAIGANWKLGDNSAPASNAFDSLNNNPPTGVADAGAPAGSQLRNATGSITTPASDFDVDVMSYTAGGVGAFDSIKCTRALVFAGCNNTTGPITMKCLSNPADTSQPSTTINTGTVGTWPSGWKACFGAIQESPSGVAVGTRPTIRVHRNDANVAFVYDVAYAGLYVAFETGVQSAPPVIPPPAFTVTAGDRDITALHDGLTFSNVDPGGFESLQLTSQAVDGLYDGQRVTVRIGQDVAWDGVINEVGPIEQSGAIVAQLAALGYSARLKDNPYQEIYVDRDFGRWVPPSNARLVQLELANLMNQSFIVTPDTTGPTLVTRLNGAWTLTTKPNSDAWYRAEVPVGSLYAAWSKSPDTIVNSADANWSWLAFSATSDDGTVGTAGAEQRAAGPSTFTLTPTVPTLFFAIRLRYLTGPAGTEGMNFDVRWSVLAVYGTHGLPKRGTNSATSAQGFYLSDVFAHAMKKSGVPLDLIITEASSYIIPHLIYPDLTGSDQVATDAANILGWHWGIWEPRTVFDTTPTARFQPPPTDATVVVSRADCIEIDVPKARLDALYDTAKVKYTDSAGIVGIATVTVANPLLGQAAISGLTRVLTLDMGVGSAAAAQQFGRFALLLSQRAARGGGSATLPGTVTTVGGGNKPACLLKAGRDRIRITDMSDSGPLHETDTRRFDTFHIRRVETTVNAAGTPETRVEFDDGADLLEVLQARLAISTKLAGG